MVGHSFFNYPNDLNKHEAIKIACNKLSTYSKLESLNYEYLPQWCTSKYEADQMLYRATDGGTTLGSETIYCRTTLTGHSGSGIVLAKYQHELVDAPLYTLGTKNKLEFRVHVFKGEIIDIQQKKKRAGVTGNAAIRNHANGYIYARSDINVPDVVIDAAIKAVNSLGLDFGACDIGYNQLQNKAYLFEVNTAPGITGTTLEKYANTFTNYLRSL